jgi:hypothetical protein
LVFWLRFLASGTLDVVGRWRFAPFYFSDAMTEPGEKPTHAQAAASARAARLAEELRANLRKRKEKARMTEAPAPTQGRPGSDKERSD